jgi:hypothetical protein
MTAMSAATFFASISSTAAGWIQDPANASVGLAGAVLDISTHLRNVYPANNFNRDVTTSWWETQVLDGHDSIQSSELSGVMRDASFIVLNDGMYSVSDHTGFLSH